jgi:hypothetical protein
MVNYLQDATGAMTPAELVKGYKTLNTTRQGELLASLDELCGEWRTERRKARRGLLGRRHDRHHRATPRRHR